MDTIEKADRHFLEMARLASLDSPDPSTKCGAVVVKDGRAVSQGCNDFPRGTDQSLEIWNNREEKYRRVVHGEVNAILNAHDDLRGATLYSWPPGHGPSCERCAGVIINAGISRVVYFQKTAGGWDEERWKSSCLLGLEMMKQAGLEIVSYTVN